MRHNGGGRKTQAAGLYAGNATLPRNLAAEEQQVQTAVLLSAKKGCRAALASGFEDSERAWQDEGGKVNWRGGAPDAGSSRAGESATEMRSSGRVF